METEMAYPTHPPVSLQKFPAMKKLQFNTTINAPREKVWSVLWDDRTYRMWTSAFSETSYAESDWKEGSSVLFLDGKGCGMYSEIASMTPNEYMSFRHLGEMKDGQKVPVTDDKAGWGNIYENYRLTQDGENTKLDVELDMPEEHAGYFEKTFPVALGKVKEIAEQNL